ncbi:MAG TPA: transcriptional regulator, partial [Acidobacteria bacterium]|nr:transcriptional regulator [Acidobacteriota bacterium]
ARAELVESIRGSKGGYRLSRPPEDISVAAIIASVSSNSAAADSTTDGSAYTPVRKLMARNWRLPTASAMRYDGIGCRISNVNSPESGASAWLAALMTARNADGVRTVAR